MSVKTMSCKKSLNPGQENFCIAYGTLKSYDLCISKEILTGKNFTNSGETSEKHVVEQGNFKDTGVN